MADAAALKTLRTELQEWIDERLTRIIDADEHPTLPIVADFCLSVAWEDAADEDSPTSYETVSSYVPGYRIYGLLSVVRRRFIPIHADDEDDD